MTAELRQSCIVVAEIGANHCQDYERAVEMVRCAWWAGADAVKVQMFTPEQMTARSSSPEFMIPDGPWAGQSLWELYERAAMPVEWVPKLLDVAKSLGMGFIASVYHPDMVPVARQYGVVTFKVASQEIGYEDLHRALCDTDCPVILSTGCATLNEIDAAVAHYGADRIVLLKCCSRYPAPLDSMNLLTIVDMKVRFGVPVGLSDHTTGLLCPAVAVSLGASMIEKHLKLPDGEGLDSSFSLDPQGFRAMVMAIHDAETAVGTVSYRPTSTRYKRRQVEGRWVRTVKGEGHR